MSGSSRESDVTYATRLEARSVRPPPVCTGCGLAGSTGAVRPSRHKPATESPQPRAIGSHSGRGRIANSIQVTFNAAPNKTVRPT